MKFGIGAAAASILLACAPVEEGATPCHEARRLFHGCGTSLSLLEGERCVGPRLAIAECVVDHAATCDELATLDVEQCVNERVEDAANQGPSVPVPSSLEPGTEPTNASPAPEADDARCADGVDNDRDGYTDCQDFDCSQRADVVVCARD